MACMHPPGSYGPMSAILSRNEEGISRNRAFDAGSQLPILCVERAYVLRTYVAFIGGIIKECQGQIRSRLLTAGKTGNLVSAVLEVGCMKSRLCSEMQFALQVCPSQSRC